MRNRISKARKDDMNRRNQISKAIETMEKKRLPVTSTRVTDRLSVGSMTPVKVCGY